MITMRNLWTMQWEAVNRGSSSTSASLRCCGESSMRIWGSLMGLEFSQQKLEVPAEDGACHDRAGPIFAIWPRMVRPRSTRSWTELSTTRARRITCSKRWLGKTWSSWKYSIRRYRLGIGLIEFGAAAWED